MGSFIVRGHRSSGLDLTESAEGFVWYLHLGKVIILLKSHECCVLAGDMAMNKKGLA